MNLNKNFHFQLFESISGGFNTFLYYYLYNYKYNYPFLPNKNAVGIATLRLVVSSIIEIYKSSLFSSISVIMAAAAPASWAFKALDVKEHSPRSKRTTRKKIYQFFGNLMS